MLCIILILQSVNVFSQIEHFTVSFESYAETHLQEKIFVHTDKENYVSGEIIWFKLFVTDALLNKPSNLSKIAYVEVLDLTHKSILQAKIELKNSMGSGSFMLPYSVQSGNYTFRCYSGLMKNESADFYFEKQLAIINPLKKPEWQEANPPIYSVQFFPEGGNLVAGMESKIGFKANDQFGNLLDATGYVEDELKQRIVPFETKKFGMGQFLFKPVMGKKYHAVLMIHGKEIFSELPNIFQQGTVMQLTENAEKQIVINVQTTYEIQGVNLLVHTRSALKAAVHQDLLDGKLRFIVPDSLLGEGISAFTLFDEQYHPLCERLFFKKPSNVMQLAAQMDKETYGKRNKVNLTLNAVNNNLPTPANLSISVFLLDSLQAAPKSNILSYLWLESDLKGEIESPEYYFSNDTDLFICTENLLLTQGWRRFQWKEVLEKQTSYIENSAELNGHIFWVRVTKKNNLQTVEGVPVYLTLPGNKPLFYQGISNKKGLVLFNIPPFFGTNQMILQTNGRSDSIYRVELMEPFSASYSNRKLHPFELKETLADLLKAHSIQSQVANVYYANQQQTFSYPEILDTVPFYGKPTNRYYLDDYTRFITMEEVFKEYIEGIKLKKSNTGFNIRLFNASYQNYFETEPLILLDGVPVFDVNQLIAFDPLKIKKIDILNEQFYQNKNVLNGIISCTTYKGDLTGYTLDPNALVLSFEGLQLKREFYQPNYSDSKSANNRLPDFRNVLFWNPSITSDFQGVQRISFYTSDITGKYLVVAQGISKNGVAGAIQYLFEVN